MSKHLARLALAAALALGATAARAGTASATMNVSANVVSNCTIAATDLAFGTYDPIGANAAATVAGELPGTANLTLTCTKKANVSVTLTKNPLVNGTSTLNYNLYSNLAHTAAWDDTAGGTVAAVGAGKAGLPLTVYGVIPGGQDPDVGAFAGTVVATVTF